MNVIVSANYEVEAKTSEIWNADGELNPHIKNGLNKKFPKNLKISKFKSEQTHMSIMQIKPKEMNFSRCPMCANFTSYEENPKVVSALRNSKDLIGYSLCKSCEWQLAHDYETGYDVKKTIEKYKARNKNKLNKKDISMLSVIYSVDAEREEFWDKSNLDSNAGKSIARRFPKCIKSIGTTANRYSLTYTCLAEELFTPCPICNSFMTDREKLYKSGYFPEAVSADDADSKDICIKCAFEKNNKIYRTIIENK